MQVQNMSNPCLIKCRPLSNTIVPRFLFKNTNLRISSQSCSTTLNMLRTQRQNQNNFLINGKYKLECRTCNNVHVGQIAIQRTHPLHHFKQPIITIQHPYPT